MSSVSHEDDNEVHHRVARLSITVDSNEERSKFLESLKSPSTSNETVEEGGITKPLSKTARRRKIKKEKKSMIIALEKLDKEATVIDDDYENNTNRDVNLNLKLTSTSKDPSPSPDGNNSKSRTKRRRSSVQQGTIRRKKKFLLEEPTFEINKNFSKKASIASIRDIVLYSLTDVNSSPRWCTLENRKSVERVVVVFLRGLTNEEFGLPDLKAENSPLEIDPKLLKPELSSFSRIFNKIIPLQSPGSKKCIYSTYSSLVSYSLSQKQKLAIQKENENKKIILPDLYLTLDDLLFNNYPIHSDVEGASKAMIEKTADYKSTRKFVHDGSKTFALDCEMCRSLNGKVLTRVSLTDFDNNVIIDELIKPSDEIVDYLTKYSGISPEMLEGVETTLTDIQDKIINVVSACDVLIGHSLESDLEVLKIKHPLIIDTSICFDHPRGPPSKASLKMLMSSHLDKIIQEKETGHNSVEDCISCMELVKLKVSKGYLFGKSYNMESLYSRIAKSNKLDTTAQGEKIPKQSLVISYSPVKNFGHVEKRIQCFSDDEIVSAFKEHQKENDFIVVKLRELEWFKDYANDIPESLALTKDVDTIYEKTNERLSQIYESLSSNSLLIICSENGDTREMLRLQKLCKTFKYKFEKDGDGSVAVEDGAWTEKNVEKLAEAVDIARDTLFLCALKTKEVSEIVVEE